MSRPLPGPETHTLNWSGHCRIGRDLCVRHIDPHVLRWTGVHLPLPASDDRRGVTDGSALKITRWTGRGETREGGGTAANPTVTQSSSTTTRTPGDCPDCG